MKKSTLPDPNLMSLGCRALNPHLFAPLPLVQPPVDVLTPKAEGEAREGKRRLQMNKTEEEFSRMLEKQKERGEIVSWSFESCMFRWGVMDILKYSPDFLVIDSTQLVGEDSFPHIKMRFIEVKGDFIRPVDLQRFKQCRNHFTMFEFLLWSKTKKEGWKQLY